MDYHVFKKPKIKNGKKVYEWYYYYTQNGKQIQKACKNCNNRSDAELHTVIAAFQDKSANITVITPSVLSAITKRIVRL
ncbi:hypothetical protein [Treponema sp.]|uniref:hypothetical protein n=1 Tax=Treponema sp. TaxID=166 RepID=UPI003FA2977C